MPLARAGYPGGGGGGDDVALCRRWRIRAWAASRLVLRFPTTPFLLHKGGGKRELGGGGSRDERGPGRVRAGGGPGEGGDAPMGWSLGAGAEVGATIQGRGVLGGRWWQVVAAGLEMAGPDLGDVSPCPSEPLPPFPPQQRGGERGVGAAGLGAGRDGWTTGVGRSGRRSVPAVPSGPGRRWAPWGMWSDGVPP